jgi:hypothetical protein
MGLENLEGCAGETELKGQSRSSALG